MKCDICDDGERGEELRSVVEQYNPQDPRKHSCQN